MTTCEIETVARQQKAVVAEFRTRIGLPPLTPAQQAEYDKQYRFLVARMSAEVW